MWRRGQTRSGRDQRKREERARAGELGAGGEGLTALAQSEQSVGERRRREEERPGRTCGWEESLGALAACQPPSRRGSATTTAWCRYHVRTLPLSEDLAVDRAASTAARAPAVASTTFAALALLQVSGTHTAHHSTKYIPAELSLNLSPSSPRARLLPADSPDQSQPHSQAQLPSPLPHPLPRHCPSVPQASSAPS